MAAGIMHCAYCTVFSAHNDDRVGPDLNREIVSGAGNFAVVTREQPVLVPDLLQVLLMVRRVDIKWLIQAVARLPVPEPRYHFFVYVHVRPRIPTRTELVAGVEE